jgi:hypothetical protein
MNISIIKFHEKPVQAVIKVLGPYTCREDGQNSKRALLNGVHQGFKFS